MDVKHPFNEGNHDCADIIFEFIGEIFGLTCQVTGARETAEGRPRRVRVHRRISPHWLRDFQEHTRVSCRDHEQGPGGTGGRTAALLPFL